MSCSCLKRNIVVHVANRRHIAFRFFRRLSCRPLGLLLLLGILATSYKLNLGNSAMKRCSIGSVFLLERANVNICKCYYYLLPFQ